METRGIQSQGERASEVGSASPNDWSVSARAVSSALRDWKWDEPGIAFTGVPAWAESLEPGGSRGEWMRR